MLPFYISHMEFVYIIGKNRYDVLGNGKAFTVEFFDEDGNTIEASLYAEYTPAQLQKVETTLTLT